MKSSATPAVSKSDGAAKSPLHPSPIPKAVFTKESSSDGAFTTQATFTFSKETSVLLRRTVLHARTMSISGSDFDVFDQYQIPMTDYSSVSLWVVWLFNLIGLNICYMLSEVYQGLYPTFPFSFFLILACHFTVICALFVYLLGRQKYGRHVYKFYQPFVGGQQFVVMQLFGVLAVALSVVMTVSYYMIFDVNYAQRGFLTVTAVLADFGQVMLLLSLRHFQAPVEGSVSANTSAERWLSVLGRRKNAESAVVIALICGQSCLNNIPLAMPQLAPMVAYLNLAMQVLIGLLIHFSIGVKHTEGYNSRVILLQRPIDTVVFWTLQLLHISSVLADVALVNFSTTASPTYFIIVSSLGALSSGALLLFTRTTSFKPKDTVIPGTVFEIGGVAISAVALLLAGINVAALTWMDSHKEEFAVPLEGTSLNRIDVLLAVLTLSQGFAMLLAPLTHMAGRVMHGEAFSIFETRTVSLGFPALQGGGWLALILSVIGAALYMSTRSPSAGALSSIFAALSVMCFSLSIREFSNAKLAAPLPPLASDEATSSAEAATAQSANADHASLVSPPKSLVEAAKASEEASATETRSPPLAYVLNGEMITAYILALCNLLLLVTVDTAVQPGWWGSAEVPALRIYFVANVCFICSVPLAHISGRDKGISPIRLFSGSGAYVALQVLGWGIYALFLIVTICIGVAIAVLGLRLPSQLPASFAKQRVVLSMVGVLELIPVILVTLSIVIESRHTISLAYRRDIAKEAFGEIKSLVSTAASMGTEEEQSVLQLAFEMMVEPALNHYQIPYTKRTLRLTEAAVVESSDEEREKEENDLVRLEERQRQYESVHTMMILMSCASATFFVMAAFFVRFPLISLAAGVCGMLVSTASCVGIHAGYGIVLHGTTGVYTVFMPFKGGGQFIRRQIGGWTCYASTLLSLLVCALENDGTSSPTIVVTSILAVVLSVVCQVLILDSIPYFSTSSKLPSFFEENGEGLVAVLVFIGAFAFGHAYDAVGTFFSESRLEVSSGFYDNVTSVRVGGGLFEGGSKRSRVPFVLSLLSLSLAVPCVLLALGRTTRHWQKVAKESKRRQQRGAPGSVSSAAEDNTDGVNSTERQTVLTTIIMNVLEVVTMLLGTVFPISFIYGIYYLSQNYTPGVMQVAERYTTHVAVLATGVVGLSLVPYFVNVKLPSFMVTLRCTVVTWSQYGMAVIVAFILFFPIVVRPCMGSYFTGITSLVLTILGGWWQVRMAINMAVYACIGYRTYLYVDDFRATDHRATSALAPELIFAYVFDVVMLAWWLWYLPLYKFNPSHTGSQRSPRCIEFARTHLFADCARYFKFRVIRDSAELQMHEPNTQYLFSFHPHGVFPGTALFCALSEEWKKAIGINDKNHVTTHVASIVFNIPFIRDYNLRLGCLSVSRKTIEASLSRGNSSLIVTGGQAEMLHTAVSDTDMIIVTHHLGFIRLAIANRVPLVPLLSLSENNVLGLIQFPRVQRVMLKILGFPFPMIPYGRFGLPLPFRTSLTLVVGSPIQIPEEARADNLDDVQKLATLYFKELKELFYRHRVEAGYPNMELHLVNDKEEAKKRREAATAAKKAQ